MTLNKSYSKTGYTSFEEMYKAECPFILGIVLRRVGNKTVAEDLAQDTFIKILRNIDIYQPQEKKEPKDSFRNWISRIAINNTINYFNRNKLGQAYSNNQIKYNLPTPEKLTIEKEGLETVIESINIISDQKKREIAWLWFIEDKSYQEISDELGIPKGTVMSRLHRAKKTMQAAVAEE